MAEDYSHHYHTISREVFARAMVATLETPGDGPHGVAAEKFLRPLDKKNIHEGLTRVVLFEYHNACMAMLLAVVSTEATDPTRVSGPFRTAANVSESSSMRVRGACMDHRVLIIRRRR